MGSDDVFVLLLLLWNQMMCCLALTLWESDDAFCLAITLVESDDVFCLALTLVGSYDVFVLLLLLWDQMMFLS